MTTNRSTEELGMREVVAGELRALWPSARIIHELPLRYSQRRIDVAAVTQDFIAVVEIKSSKDDTSRLRAQLRGFAPISTYMICALAPSHWAEPRQEEVPVEQGRMWRTVECSAANIIQEEVGYRCGVWLVTPGEPVVIERRHREADHRPSASQMLDLLHVAELVGIAAGAGVAVGKRPTHKRLRDTLCDRLTGAAARRAVCSALRARDAFDKASDPPLC